MVLRYEVVCLYGLCDSVPAGDLTERKFLVSYRVTPEKRFTGLTVGEVPREVSIVLFRLTDQLLQQCTRLTPSHSGT